MSSLKLVMMICKVRISKFLNMPKLLKVVELVKVVEHVNTNLIRRARHFQVTLYLNSSVNARSPCGVAPLEDV